MISRKYYIILMVIILFEGLYASAPGEPAYNFKANEINYTSGENDTIYVEAHYEIWGGDSVASAPFVRELRINGVPVARDSTSITPHGAKSWCYFTSPPCGGKYCPSLDLTIVPFSLPGTCEQRTIWWGETCVCVYIDFFACAVELTPSDSLITFVLDPNNYVEEFDESDNTAPVNIYPIPTLTEWGLIIFGVVLLGFITWVFLKRRRRTVVSY